MEWEQCDGDVTVQTFDCTTRDNSGGASKENSERVVMCGKTDGRTWQCKRAAKYENSLCEHHLALDSKRNCNESSDKNKKKSVELVETEGGKRRVRTQKPSTTAANPNEIYYYSGFGPRWGKRRAEDNGRDNNLSMKSLVHETSKEQSSANLMDEGLDYIDCDDDEEEDGLGKRKRAKKPVKARSLKSIM